MMKATCYRSSPSRWKIVPLYSMRSSSGRAPSPLGKEISRHYLNPLKENRLFAAIFKPFRHLMKLSHGIVTVIFLLLVPGWLSAQAPNPLIDRVCKSWAIAKLEDNGRAVPQDNAPSDYRLVFNKDST